MAGSTSKKIELTDKVWTSNHIEQYLGICRTTAYKLLKKAEKEKHFPIRRVGTHYRIPRDAFLDWFENLN